MKVLYYGMDWCLGGIEEFVKNMYFSLDKNKIQVDFLKVTETIYYEKKFRENGGLIYQIPNRKQNPFIFYLSLIKFFRLHKEYKIIHIHLNTCSCIAPIIIAKLFKRKVIVHSHNNFKQTNFIKKIIYEINRKILNMVIDVRLACSIPAGQYMFKNKKFNVINNGICTKEYKFNEKTREWYRNQMGIKEGFVIGHIGRFVYQKNHEYLIEIFKHVYEQDKNAVLLLVGDGKLRSIIEKKVERYGLDKNVIFTGVREDVPMILQAMDVFVVPSRFEGLGIVAIEAQASGLPCIVSNKVPNEAYITELVETVSLQDSVQSWTEKILKYRKNFSRKDMTKSILESGFDRMTSVEKLEKLYLSYEEN